MKISEKLERFRSGRGILGAEISEQAASQLGFRDLRILRKCHFEDGVSVQSQILAPSFECFFGAYSYMNDGGYVRKNTFFGRYCSVGRRVTVAAGMHRTVGLSTSPFVGMGTGSLYSQEELETLGQKVKLRARNTIIMNDVWIGDGAVVLPGVTIGTGAVVASNAVVT
ncbi:MAG: hypothetical protein ACK42D_04525, partial [Candidatus Paceibacteria bacterium]